ncbi:MAG: 50S ribosomal protein L11 methyltransferase [Oscillospiraceae bacterium]|jgi:ribosomal protein L11 methyltransferase|nr:50S ribosomal protein L11 methyltransferase [Oscillospiraceae bacterium]
MKFIEATVHTTTEAADLVAEFAREEGAMGAYIIDKNDLDQRGEAAQWDTIDEETLKAMPDDALVRAVFAPERAGGVKTLRERLDVLLGDSFGLNVGALAVETRELDDADWADAWKKYFKPFRVGNRIIIKPSWEDFSPAPTDVVLELDPGMAFGTGTHETTALSLELLEDVVRAGDIALDVGTGSGILAIAAAKLGARRVLAVDQDPDAVKVAQENVERNGLTDFIRTGAADLLEGLEDRADTRAYVIGRADLVIANILADVVIRLMPSAFTALRTGGKMVVSGIIKDRAEDARDAFRRAGFTVEGERAAGEWIAMVARKG